MPVLAANPGNLFDDVGIGKMVRSAPPLVVIPITDAPVMAAIDLIEGNLRAAPEVTLRAEPVSGQHDRGRACVFASLLNRRHAPRTAFADGHIQELHRL